MEYLISSERAPEQDGRGGWDVYYRDRSCGRVASLPDAEPGIERAEEAGEATGHTLYVVLVREEKVPTPAKVYAWVHSDACRACARDRAADARAADDRVQRAHGYPTR